MIPPCLKLGLEFALTNKQQFDIVPSADLQHAGRIEYRIKTVRYTMRAGKDRKQIGRRNPIGAPCNRMITENSNIAPVRDGRDVRFIDTSTCNPLGDAGRQSDTAHGAAIGCPFKRGHCGKDRRIGNHAHFAREVAS